MRSIGAALASLLTLALPLAGAGAATIANGYLSMGISDGNGAITSAKLGGVEFYAVDALVADWGMQVVGDASTFALNTTGGRVGAGMTIGAVTQVTPRQVRVTARYAPRADVDISIMRTYTLLSGLDVVRVDTRLRNERPSGVTVLRAFGTYDPDPGGRGANETINQTTFEASSVLGMAHLESGLGVAIGGPPRGSVVVGFGGGTSPFGLGIGNAAELEAFFTTPFDPGGTTGDLGIGVGRQVAVVAGNTKVLRYYHAFGVQPADMLAGIRFGAREARDSASSAAVTAAVVTPLPAAVVLLACALGALAWTGWRQRRDGGTS